MEHRIPRAGTRGSYANASVKADDKAPAETVLDVRTGEIVEPDLLPRNPAYVGISVSAGASSKFARQKIEVAAWCTLPCHPNTAARQAAFDQAMEDVMDQVMQRLDQAADAVHPDVNWKEPN